MALKSGDDIDFFFGSESDYNASKHAQGVAFLPSTKQIMVDSVKYIPKKLSELTNDINYLTPSTLSSAKISVGQLSPIDALGYYSASVGNVDYITACINDPNRGSRLFDTPADDIIIEYSRDGGVTWEDYQGDTTEATYNVNKRKLFMGLNPTFYLGKATTKEDNSIDNQLRITIANSDRYCNLNRVAIYYSTNGNSTGRCSLEAAKADTPTEFTTVFTDKGLSGWAGWNVIWFAQVLYNKSANASHHKYLRLTFKMSSVNTSYVSSSVLAINFYGSTMWGIPTTAGKNMAANGRLYHYNEACTAIFPALIQGTRLQSTVATGTAPLTVASTTHVPNLNADMLDGLHADSFFQDRGTITASTIETRNNGVYNTNNYSPIDGAYKYGTLLNFKSGSTNVQMYVTDFFGGANDRVFIRSQWNNTRWAEWREIATTISTVANSLALGGVALEDIHESGWNKVNPGVSANPYCYKIAELGKATNANEAIIEIRVIGDSNRGGLSGGKLRIAHYYNGGSAWHAWDIFLSVEAHYKCPITAYIDVDGGVWISGHSAYTSSLQWRVDSNGSYNGYKVATIYNASTATQNTTGVPDNVVATAHANQYASYVMYESGSTTSNAAAGLTLPMGDVLQSWYNDTAFDVLKANMSGVELQARGGVLTLGGANTTNINVAKAAVFSVNPTVRTATARIELDTTTVKMMFGVGSGATNRGIYDHTSAAWMIGNNGTNTFSLLGNFGIGTESPQYKLHVNGTAYIASTLTVDAIKIGSATITWDATNGMLHIDKGLYSDGAISSKGLDTSASGSGGVSLTTVWESLTSNSGNFGSTKIHVDHMPDFTASKITDFNESVTALIPTAVGRVLHSQFGFYWFDDWFIDDSGTYIPTYNYQSTSVSGNCTNASIITITSNAFTGRSLGDIEVFSYGFENEPPSGKSQLIPYTVSGNKLYCRLFHDGDIQFQGFKIKVYK